MIQKPIWTNKVGHYMFECDLKMCSIGAVSDEFIVIVHKYVVLIAAVKVVCVVFVGGKCEQ